ncbi:LapA family protein [Rhizobium binxianense]
MARKIVNLLILLPLGVILIVFCVANRQIVTLAFNPFRPEDQVLSVSAPLFVFLFIALIVGMLVGSAATWLSQGKHRKRARSEAKEAIRWHAEADRHKSRAEEIAGQLPSR